MGGGVEKRARKGKCVSLKYSMGCDQEPLPPKSLVRASSGRVVVEAPDLLMLREKRAARGHPASDFQIRFFTRASLLRPSHFSTAAVAMHENFCFQK